MAHDTYMVVHTKQNRYTIVNYEAHEPKSKWYKATVDSIIAENLHYPDALKLWHKLNGTVPIERS
jgi:hypothetical protein